ncbi:thioredoxin family protein [Herbidospora mongoliensis]|uniref:thioredoxin family protein n=1 Tax=Herbidospora mongoliensis TaxID=688067 RepID=UPI000832CF54|nr:thioredoxin family protein [Herbidospora mongoliensis]
MERALRFPETALPGEVHFVVIGDRPAGQTMGEFRPTGEIPVPSDVELAYVAATTERLGEVPEMTGLRLSGVCDDDLRLIAKRSTLRDLAVTGRFTDEGVRAIQGLTTLESLELWSPNITGDVPLPEDSPLIKVKIGGSSVVDAAFGHLARTTAAVVAVSGESVRGHGLGALGAMPTLRYLRLGSENIEPGCLWRLGSSESLAILSLAGPVDCEAVLSFAPPLKEIDLDHVSRADCARLLFHGLAVNGLSGPPRLADAYARMLTGPDRPTGIAPRRRIVTGERDLTSLVMGPAPVLLIFTSRDCLASEWIAPVIDRIVAEYDDELIGAVADVETAIGAATAAGVDRTPTVLLTRKGEELLRLPGIRSHAELIRRVTGTLGLPMPGEKLFPGRENREPLLGSA